MLTFEPPFFQIRGATIFRDHEDPDLFHLLPGQPAIPAAAQGQLEFRLYKYRRDLTDNPAMEPGKAKGAGLCLFETELPLLRAELIRAELASASGRPDARLSPVVFRAGTVRALLVKTSGESMIDDVLDSHPAPLTPPHRAVFAASLTAEGATLFEQAALGGDVPTGVIYELRFLALSPSLHARVRMDYERIYDHFSASVGFTYYVSVKLDLDISWLVEHGFIRIEITAFVDGADKERQERFVMEIVKQRVKQDFFRSGMPPKPGEGMSGPLADLLGGMLGENVTSASALFVLKAKAEFEREKKDFEFFFNGRTAIELTHVSAGLISTLTRTGGPIIREIDLDDPFFSTLKVQVYSAIDFEQLTDLQQATVEIAYHDHRKAFTFAKETPGPFVFEAAMADPRQDEYQYSVAYQFRPNSGDGPSQINSGPFRTRLRTVTLDPLAHFRAVRIRMRRINLDFARVPRQIVHLRIPGEEGNPDEAKSTITLGQENPGAEWRVRLPIAFRTPRVLARVEWENPQGERKEISSEAELESPTFNVPDPFHEIIEITLECLSDWIKVRQVYVEVRYVDGEHRVDQTVLFQEGVAASKTLPIPVIHREQRSFNWKQTIVNKDGTKLETDWVQSDGAVLIVGAVAPPNERNVRVVWISPAPGSVGLQIDFWVITSSGDEEQTSVFISAPSGPSAETVATLPLDSDGRLNYRFQAKRLTESGEEIVKVGEAQTPILVIR